MSCCEAKKWSANYLKLKLFIFVYLQTFSKGLQLELMFENWNPVLKLYTLNKYFGVWEGQFDTKLFSARKPTTQTYSGLEKKSISLRIFLLGYLQMPRVKSSPYNRKVGTYSPPGLIGVLSSSLWKIYEI